MALRSVDDPLTPDGFLVPGPGRRHFGSRTHLRHGDVPPMAAGLGRNERIGVDDEDGGPSVRLRLDERAFELGDRRNLSGDRSRSEEHTSELQSLMRISYAVFCLKKKNNKPPHN